MGVSEVMARKWPCIWTKKEVGRGEGEDPEMARERRWFRMGGSQVRKEWGGSRGTLG